MKSIIHYFPKDKMRGLLPEHTHTIRYMSALRILNLPACVLRQARRRRRRAVLAEISRNGPKFDFTRIPLSEDLIREDRNR